jgi:hypothetical protein
MTSDTILNGEVSQASVLLGFAATIAIEREAVLNVRLEALFARNAALDATKQEILERVRNIGELP